MTVAGPDIVGFKAAMDSLRVATGTIVAFQIPVPPTYASTVALADDGTPFDPTVTPTSGGGFTAVTKRVGTIFKEESALRPGADTRTNESGMRSGIDAIFDLAAEDYPDVRNATEVWMDDLRLRIVEWKPFSMDLLLRYSVYCEER